MTMPSKPRWDSESMVRKVYKILKIETDAEREKVLMQGRVRASEEKRPDCSKQEADLRNFRLSNQSTPTNKDES